RITPKTIPVTDEAEKLRILREREEYYKEKNSRERKKVFEKQDQEEDHDTGYKQFKPPSLLTPILFSSVTITLLFGFASTETAKNRWKKEENKSLFQFFKGRIDVDAEKIMMRNLQNADTSFKKLKYTLLLQWAKLRDSQKLIYTLIGTANSCLAWIYG
ncbi:hypothetical protein HK099_002770, partial [Clydaea vesicula]